MNNIATIFLTSSQTFDLSLFFLFLLSNLKFTLDILQSICQKGERWLVLAVSACLLIDYGDQVVQN